MPLKIIQFDENFLKEDPRITLLGDQPLRPSFRFSQI